MNVIQAPCPGAIVSMANVPDPVFAAGIVGPGVAIDPLAEPHEATCPINGTLLKIHPHAFVVLGDDSRGVLVHLGINTVELEGKGFTLLASEGSKVDAGTPIVRWDPAAVAESGRSPVVVVIALDAKPDALTQVAAEGAEIKIGDALFTWG